MLERSRRKVILEDLSDSEDFSNKSDAIEKREL